MKTIKRIVIVFILLFVSGGIISAQQKTDDELLREYKELLQKNRELLDKSKKQKEETQPEKAAKKQQEKAEPKKPIEKPQKKVIQESPKTVVPPQPKPVKKPVINPQAGNKWSLEECIQHAIDHNISIKQLYLQQEEAGIQQNTAENSRLPNLNASMGQEWSFTRTENLVGKYEDVHQGSSTVSAQSVTPIFTGFKIPNQIARAKLEFEIVTQNLEKAKEDLSLNITSLFLQVLLFKELYKINEKQLELSQIQVERTRLLVLSGSVPKSQLSDIEAQVAKDRTAVVEAQNNFELALLDLAQSLELEKNEDFDIYAPDFSGDIIAEFINSLQPPSVIYENALNFKPSIKGQELKVESSRKNLKIAESGYYPQLDLSLGIGTRYNHFYKPTEQTNPITSELIQLNRPFKDQIRDYGSRLVSLNLSIPIFNRFQVRNQVRSARVDIMNQQLILENNKKILYKEIQTAHKNASAAREKYISSGQAEKAASESFRQSQKRYELGKASVFEFNEAKTRLIQSQSEQTQAKYEYILRTKILDFYNGIPIKF